MCSYGLVLLAAGASSRLGQPKQLLNYNGKSLLKHAVLTALQAIPQPVVVVFGAKAHLLHNEVEDLPVHVVNNFAWKDGMSSSVSSGLSALLKISPGIDNVIFMVCDQPFVTAPLINDMVTMHKESGRGIVACTYNNTAGTPVLFNRKYFDELMGLQGAHGAKKMINKYPDDVATVAFPMGFVDIDNLKDYEALLNNTFINPEKRESR